jgi:hypothetical protein
MSFLPKALFVEIASSQALPPAPALEVASVGADRIIVSSTKQAIQSLAHLQQNTLAVLVSNTADVQLFAECRKRHPHASTVLMTDHTIHQYATDLESKDTELLDHVIANVSERWAIDDLRITIQKILRKDIFGIEKYLQGETAVFHKTVSSSLDRDVINSEVQKWAESCGLGKNIGRLAFGITEELLMNAIFDAPIAGGRANYELLERTSHRNLQPDEYSELSFAYDSRILAISIADPFGAFKREKWWHYTRKILKRDDTEVLIDTKKGGAGLGIFKILYSSHGVVCNIDPGKKTEVIVLIDSTHPVRDFAVMPRSIHYFST